MTHPVYLETGARRTFACSLEWPGWCRSGRDEEAALRALEEYGPRYATIAAAAGTDFDPAAGCTVVERLAGSATTDFGAIGAIPSADRVPLGAERLERDRRVVAAAWSALDAVAAAAPAALRKGPRGGGRDRDPIVTHVIEAERQYARKIGLLLPRIDPEDRSAVASARAAVLDSLNAIAVAEQGWPPAYAARRIAWHVLDHAWEIEDRGS